MIKITKLSINQVCASESVTLSDFTCRQDVELTLIYTLHIALLVLCCLEYSRFQRSLQIALVLHLTLSCLCGRQYFLDWCLSQGHCFLQIAVKYWFVSFSSKLQCELFAVLLDIFSINKDCYKLVWSNFWQLLDQYDLKNVIYNIAISAVISQRSPFCHFLIIP